jgi:hypothetical protein
MKALSVGPRTCPIGLSRLVMLEYDPNSNVSLAGMPGGSVVRVI